MTRSGGLHIIGATTIDEYRKDIEKDAALERRFQPVLVPEPSQADTIEILRELRDRYEAHHQVRYTDEALIAAAQLSDRYITDRFLPDKAAGLLDHAGARVRLRAKRPLQVTAEDIAGVVSRLTGIPVDQLTHRAGLGDPIEETSRRLHTQAITVEFTTEAVDWLARRGFQPEFGARPLRRTMRRDVDNPLSAMLLDGRLVPHQHVTVACEDDALAFRVTDLEPVQVPAQAAASQDTPSATRT